ncbi:MAG: DUF255 domain-containing protein, partial [Candidatus Tumulicola sp.]
MNEFRFSPRSNRASEIAWMPWESGAFERARAEDKPILLSISAVWCHWCHVMDETSYSDPGVIAAINERFVPIRVDNDRRPDVNARYNMGGWPTTAFLAPDGSTIAGATYLTPEQMRRALGDIAQFYRENKAGIAQRAAAMPRRADYVPSSPDRLGEAAIAGLVEEIGTTYDDEYGGFGDAPKFPQPDLLEFLLSEWRLSRDEHLYAMVATTMLGMSRGGMYDRVEGGFFRYSTTRDWSVPHFEKMAEDHAGLLRVLAQLALFAPTRDFQAILVSAVRYVREVLRDPKTGFFAGSQDADEAYFALPLEERRKRRAPFVDRTSYTNWTCGLAGAWFLAARALDDDAMVRDACQTLDGVHDRLMDPDGLAYHFVVPGDSPQVRGLLTDQTAYLRALLEAHETSGESRFVERAQALAGELLARFEAADGGFYDHLPLEDQLGRLDIPDRPIVDNALLAESLVRLSGLTGEPQYRDSAGRTLALYADTFAAAGSFAAPYGRALRRWLSPELSVRVVGEPAATDAFREAALRLRSPAVAVRSVRPA